MVVSVTVATLSICLRQPLPRLWNRGHRTTRPRFLHHLLRLHNCFQLSRVFTRSCVLNLEFLIFALLKHTTIQIWGLLVLCTFGLVYHTLQVVTLPGHESIHTFTGVRLFLFLDHGVAGDQGVLLKLKDEAGVGFRARFALDPFECRFAVKVTFFDQVGGRKDRADRKSHSPNRF